MSKGKTIAFFPSPGAVGPAMNLIGIAQGLKERGHRPVFCIDPNIAGLVQGYGLEELLVSCLPPRSPEEFAQMVDEFLRDALAAFRSSPYEQISTYVKTCMEATVDSVSWGQKALPAAFAQIQPDLIVKDNVALYPVTEMQGCPWVRVISCCESEIRDPDIPPFLSGCHENDRAECEKFLARFTEVIKPIHDRFNEVVRSTGHAPLTWPDFEPLSPHLNLLLCPGPLRFARRHPLDFKTCQYLDGCVRYETEPYEVPKFKKHDDKPLVYLSFGSMGIADIELIKRMIAVLGALPFRVLVNVGMFEREYSEIPDNIQAASWFKQTALIPHCDVVIQHGGNNTLNETLYHGKRPILMPFAWDGHDNAARIADTQHGVRLPRYDWTEQQLADALERVMTDRTINENLARTCRYMQANDGRKRAASLIENLLQVT